MAEDGRIVYKFHLDDTDAEKQAQAAGEKAGGKIGGAFKAAGVAISAATGAITAFAKGAVSAGADFDSSMSQVAATMGKSVDEIQELRDFAQEMGSTTAFSASEAADALNYMALAGYDAETSMAMLPNVLNLAAAGGIDLARASDMVTDAQSALGLSLEETEALVDQMAKASSTTNTSVEQLGDALLTVGGTAKDLAFGAQEATQVLGLLADNGVKGAEGGTALRNIILALEAPTNTAAKAIEKLGLEVFDGEGNMRDMESIFLDLNDALSEMSQGDRANALSDIFNKNDLKSVNALLATTEERWDEVWQATDHASGSAAKMAETQLDNLNGDITLFKSALEGTQIALSDALTPTLREFVQFGSDGLGRLTSAFKEGGLSGAMSEFGDILSEGLKMLIDMLPQVIEAGTSLLSALIQGIIENLPTLVSAGLQIIMTLAESLSSNISTMLPAIISVIQQIAMMFANPSTLSQLIDAAFAILNALADFFLENLPVFLEQAPVLVAALVDTLVENADRLLAAAVELIAKLVVGIVENLPKIVESGGKIVKSLVQGIGDLISDAVKAGTDLVKKIGDGLKEKIADAKQWGKDLIQNFIDGILGMWESLKATVNKVAGVIGDFLGFSEPDEGPLSNFHTFAPDMMKLYAQGIHDNRDLVLKEVDALASMMNFSPEITGRGTFERNVSYKLAATGTTAARQIVVPVNLNGREIARATAVQMGEQLAWEEMQ